MTSHVTRRAHASRLLFVHGFAADSWVWKEQVKEFAKDYDVVTIDLYRQDNRQRAKGKGQKTNGKGDKIFCLTPYTFSPKPLIGIGWSLGASVLMAEAVKRPELFKGLILVGATPCFVKRDDFPWAQPKPLVKRMLKDLENLPKETLTRFYPLNFTDEELKTKQAKEFIKHYSPSAPRLKPPIETFEGKPAGAGFSLQPSALQSSLAALLNLDIRDDIKKIHAKTLVIHGDKDIVCPVSAGEYIAKNIRGAAIEIFRDAGHAPFLTRANQFNKIVKGFLENL